MDETVLKLSLRRPNLNRGDQAHTPFGDNEPNQHTQLHCTRVDVNTTLNGEETLYQDRNTRNTLKEKTENGELLRHKR